MSALFFDLIRLYFGEFESAKRNVPRIRSVPYPAIRYAYLSAGSLTSLHRRGLPFMHKYL